MIKHSISKKILKIIESVNCSMNEGILDKRISMVKNDSAKRTLTKCFIKAKEVFKDKIPHVIWLFNSYISDEDWEYLTSTTDIPSFVSNGMMIAEQHLDRFEHYYSYGIPAIDRCPLKGNPGHILTYFGNQVKKWEKENGRLIPLGKTKDATVILECSDPKFVWFDLNTNDCRVEAGAGNHCARDTYADTLWSLREKVFDVNGELKGYISRITASYRKKGNALIQIKGHKNSKPINYKDYFIELAKKGLFERIDLETAYKNYIDLYWTDFTVDEIKEMYDKNKNLEKDKFFKALCFGTEKNSKVKGTNGVEYYFNLDGIIESEDVFVEWEEDSINIKYPEEVKSTLKEVVGDYSPDYIKYTIKDGTSTQFELSDNEVYTCLPIKKEDIFRKNLNIVLHSYKDVPAIQIYSEGKEIKYWCKNGEPIEGEKPYLFFSRSNYSGKIVKEQYFYCENDDGLLCEIYENGKICEIYTTEYMRCFLVRYVGESDLDYSYYNVYEGGGEYWLLPDDTSNWELYSIGDNPVSGRYENGKKRYEVFEGNYDRTCISYFDNGKVSGIERYDVEGRGSENDELRLNNEFKPSYEYFFENGKKKREEWYKDNELHRDDGPAVSQWDESGNIVKEEYWLNGIEVDEEEVTG